MQNRTLVFIPDISGFTSFVNNTAIEHSQHIISELLEIIIDANKTNLSISEIEGDAVLFFKNDSIPDFEVILDQSQEMFLRFHTHLNEIEQANVCQCGACRTASNLSLKFVVHLGKIEEVSVKQFNKLIGSDLILAHRLLKNNIDGDEYLLLSQTYLEEYPIERELLADWIEVQSSMEEVTEFGKIQLKYIDYSPLLNKIPELVKKNKPKSFKRKPEMLVTINAPMLLVHKILTDIESKYEYAPKIKKIVTEDKINRINSSHTCVFDNQEIHFVTKNNSIDDKQIAYSEEAQLKKGFKFLTDYRLQEKNGRTELSVYIFKAKHLHNSSDGGLNRLKEYLFLKLIILGSKRGIRFFKNYCEETFKKALINKKV